MQCYSPHTSDKALLDPFMQLHPHAVRMAGRWWGIGR